MFRIARTGSPLRDLPPGFGNWNTIYRRFRNWARAGVFDRMFNGLSDQPDMEMAVIDGTIVKVHRAGQGAKGGLSVRLQASQRAAGPPRYWLWPTRSGTL